MRKSTIIILAFFFSLMLFTAVSAELVWPGEKKFAGYTNLDQLKPVFDQDTSAYGRRYLIQALPFFVEKNNITTAPPGWLVQDIRKAVVSSDVNLALEGIIAVQRLKIYGLTDTLVGVYRKARMTWAGNMPRIHLPIIGCLISFNNAQSRLALADIVVTPLPVVIEQDIVPALRAINQIGDSTCAGALAALSAKLRSSKDSIVAFQKRTPAAAADTALVNKLEKISALADGIKSTVQTRGSAK